MDNDNKRYELILHPQTQAYNNFTRINKQHKFYDVVALNNSIETESHVSRVLPHMVSGAQR